MGDRGAQQEHEPAVGVREVGDPEGLEAGAYGRVGGRERRLQDFAVLVLVAVETTELEEADELDETVRGAGGFGSTGR